jgi:hypothetical protein
MNKQVCSLFLVSWAISTAATTSVAQERSRTWEVGYRAGTALGDGEPYNDLPIAGHVFVRRHLDGPWSVSAWIESAGGDFELPAKVVGLVQDPNTSDIDSDLSVLSVGLSGERALWQSARGSRLYALLGVAYSAVDADDVSGPLAGGGTFDVTTDPGSEVLGSLGLGYQLRLGERFSLEAVARYDHHFASWEVRDRISGSTGSIDDYSAYAFLVGLTYSF